MKNNDSIPKLYAVRKVTRNEKYEYYIAPVCMGQDPKTGKRIIKEFTGKTKDEATKKCNEYLIKQMSGSNKDPLKITVEQAVNYWYEHYVKDYVKPYTRDSYNTIINEHIIPNIGKILLCELDTDDIQKMYNALLKTHAPKTIKNIHGVVNKMLMHYVKCRKIDYNPAGNCSLPKVKKKEVEPLSIEQSNQVIEAIKGHKFERVYTFTLFTGLREGEVLGLTWDDVDWDNYRIKIDKQLIKSSKYKGATYCLGTPKNDKSRSIVVHETIMEILTKQHEWQLSMQELLGSEWNNELNLVFTNETGRYLVHGTVYKNFKKILCDLGMSNKCFHTLRHSYASNALCAGDNIKMVQENLGHSTASFTMQTYAHVVEEERVNSANKQQIYIEKNFPNL